ncbi:MAG: T9SS type A sorting domain-containing protein, partial [Rhizobacter sp.]|nr:T9SS type A sorting domain-containing protein [Chlorobiales bacterium]
KEFALRQNYPNPFNPQTTISYDILDRSQVSIVLYNALGQKVKELVSAAQDRGRYTVVLNASGLSSGVYFYRIVATGGKQNFVWSKKMTLLK